MTFDSGYQPASPKFRADRNRSYREIEREAMMTRRTLGYSPDERLPSNFFEALSGFRTGSRQQLLTEYSVEELCEGVEAQTYFRAQPRPTIVIALSEETYDELQVERPRARFSAAHELGHAVLHYRELVRLSRIPHSEAALLRGSIGELPAYSDAEWQANAFAGALLMPAAALKSLEDEVWALEAREIANAFGTSLTSARYRLQTFAQKRELLLKLR